jgi:P-type Ca2+ transporter type 2C
LHRLEQIGPNTLPQPPGVPLWRRILRAVRDPLVLVLLGAIVLTVLTGDRPDTIVIALVIVVNTTLSVRQEIRADRAVSALARLVAPVIRVLRDDRELGRPVAELVPGDLVVLAEGDLVPADSLLIGGASMRSTSLRWPGSPCRWTSPSSPTPVRDQARDQAQDQAPTQPQPPAHRLLIRQR